MQRLAAAATPQARRAARPRPRRRAPPTTAAGSSSATKSLRSLALAEQQPADQVHRDRRRAVADVGARAGQLHAPRQRAARRRDTQKQTVPTGLSSVPPPGPAMPVMPTPTSAPSRSRAPVGQRLGDLGRHRADALDQRRVDARQRDLRLVRRRRRARRARTSEEPGALGQPRRRAGRRCTTRRWRSSARCSRSSAATCSSIVVPSSENSVSAWRSRTTRLERVVGRPRPAARSA